MCVYIYVCVCVCGVCVWVCVCVCGWVCVCVCVCTKEQTIKMPKKVNEKKLGKRAKNPKNSKKTTKILIEKL